MKKILFLLLCTVSIYGQTYPTNPTAFGKISINTNIEDNTATKVSVQSSDNRINWLQPINIPIPYSPANYIPTALTIGGHLTGIDNKLGTIVATTAGITTRVWFTADQTTITAGTFDLTNPTGKGTVASHVQSVTNDDNQKKYFTTDLVGNAFASDAQFPPGIYAGNLSASTTPNSAQQRWTVELYKCDNNGTPIASGVTGAVVGDLGVTVITILDSGLLTLADGSVTNVQVSGNVGGTGLAMLSGQRIRYHVSAEKVGTASSNITESVYYGSSFNSYLDVPVTFDTNSVLNKSTVVGATTTEALNNLNNYDISVGKKLNYVTPEDYGAVGDGVTDDKTAIQNAVNSGKPVHLSKKRYFISGTIDLPGGTIIRGTGTGLTTNINITANAPAFAVKGNNINIDGVSFIGDYAWISGSYTTAKPNQHGIAVIGSTDFTIDYEKILVSNCTFYQMSGGGIYITYDIGGSVSNVYSGAVQATNCLAYGCYVGYYADIRGEYNTFVNCKAYKCAIGFRAAGGNNIFTGGILNSNNTGAYLEGGANNGHATLSSTSLNHNIQYGLWTKDVTLGYNITDCQIYSNNIYFNNSVGIEISGGGISVSNIYAQTSSKIAFTDVSFRTTPTNLYFNYNGVDNTGTLSDVKFFNSKWWGVVPVAITPNQLDNGLTVSGNIVANPATTANQVVIKSQLDAAATSGTYTPTLTNTTNVTGATLVTAIYTKVGGIVTVTIGLNANATAANVDSQINITLPVTRVSSSSLYAGSASGWGVSYYSGSVTVINTTTAALQFKPLATGTNSFAMTFSYKAD